MAPNKKICATPGCNNKTKNLKNNYCLACWKEKTKEQQKTCLGCRNPILASDKFCSRCGASLEQQKEPPSDQNFVIKRPPKADIDDISKEKFKDFASQNQASSTSLPAEKVVGACSDSQRVLNQTVIHVESETTQRVIHIGNSSGSQTEDGNRVTGTGSKKPKRIRMEASIAIENSGAGANFKNNEGAMINYNDLGYMDQYGKETRKMNQNSESRPLHRGIEGPADGNSKNEQQQSKNKNDVGRNTSVHDTSSGVSRDSAQQLDHLTTAAGDATATGKFVFGNGSSSAGTNVGYNLRSREQVTDHPLKTTQSYTDSPPVVNTKREFVNKQMQSSEGSSVDKNSFSGTSNQTSSDTGTGMSYAQAAGTNTHYDGRRGGQEYRKDTNTNSTKPAAPQTQHKDLQIPCALRDHKEGEMMKIYFHAVLTPEFNFNNKTDTVYIRFGTKEFGSFNYNAVMMVPEKKESSYVFMTGVLEVKPYYLRPYHNYSSNLHFIEYKYCCVRRSNAKIIYEYEFLYNQTGTTIVNRAFMTQRTQPRAGGVWHQYDGMIQHPKLVDRLKEKNTGEQKSVGLRERLTGWLSKVLGTGSATDRDERLAIDCKIALLSYLPQWDGFVCEYGQNIEPCDAIEQFLQVNATMDGIWTKNEKYYRAELWCPTGYSESEILLHFLLGKIAQLGSSHPSKNIDKTVATLTSALAIMHVIRKANININREQRHCLLHALTLPVNLKRDQYILVVDRIKEQFKTFLDDMIVSLVQLCNRAMSPVNDNDFDDSWLLVVPLVHFLRGDSNPMEWPEKLDKLSYNDDNWWGHYGLRTADSKKYRKKTMEQLPGLLEKLQQLFQIDILLQRTFLYSMSIIELTEIFHILTFDFFIICCSVGRIIYQMNDTYDFSRMQELQIILTVITENTMRFKTEGQLAERDAKATRVIVESLGLCIKRSHDNESLTTIPLLLQLFVASIDRCITASDKDWMEHIKDVVEDVGQSVRGLMKSVFSWNKYTYMLGYLNNLFNVEFKFEELDKIWKEIMYKSLQEAIRSNIYNRHEKEKLVTHYCNTEFSQFNSIIEAVFSEAAFGVIDKVMEGASVERFLDGVSLGSHEAAKYGQIFSHFLEKSLKHKNAMTLQYLLNWKPLAGFFRLTVSGKGSITLTVEAQELLCKAQSIMEDIVLDSILNGSVTVNELALIRRNKDQFFKLCEVMDVRRVVKKYLPPDVIDFNISALVRNVVKQREREVDEFEDFCLRVAVIHTLCQEICYDEIGRKTLAVDIRPIKRFLAINKDQMQLKELCCPAEVQMIMTAPCPPKIMSFSLSANFLEVLPEIQKIHLSRIFRDFWQTTIQRVLQQRGHQEQLLTLDDVEKIIWQNVKQEWDDFGESLITGDITLNSVNKNLSLIKDTDLELQLKHFRTGNQSEDTWVKERCNQIRLHRQLGRCLETAKTIQKIQETFRLKGDFNAIELLCSTTEKEFNSKCLKDLNKDVAKACKELENVSKGQSDCLKTLMKCKNLIIWIKNEIKSMHDLKVFVDLAMIQAGETPIEVDRVTCLHQAATGYAAFIFDLTEDSGYRSLMDICSLTWKALENDPQLSKKLMDISRFMDWLKGIKDSHGSVEVTSLRQVETINAKGIYEIGKLENGSLRLRVPAVDNEERIYTVEQLKDLQSKLMLVAGKAHRTTDAKAEVDRFVEVFDGAQDLEKYYHKMCASGNVLFTDLKIKLKCDKSRRFPVEVDFCVDDQKPLFGVNEELTEILKEMLFFMHTSLKQWYSYIDEKRDEFYYLNVYTTKQLVILRRALAKFGEKDVNHEIYALLSLVKPNCRVQDLKKAVLAVAKEKMLKDSEVEEDSVEEEVEKKDVFPNENKEELVKFWNEMEDMAISEEQAMAFLEDKRKTNVEEAVAFHLDTPYPDDLLADLVERFIARVGCSLSDLADRDANETESNMEIDEDTRGLLNSVEEQDNEELLTLVGLHNHGQATESVRNDLLKGMENFKGTLVEKLRCLWKNYLSSTKSVDLSDYISVETLGKVLQYLAPSDCNTVCRNFPQLLKIGHPNLIVCPESDVLHTVLSVYMEGNGSLPGYDEVLLCNSETTLEEVVLLWRRALNNTNNNKTYCLVNADALYYEVAVEAVIKLHQLMKGKSGYKLVIICNREREDQSYMVTALNSDRISSDKRTCQRKKDIQEYLHRQFKQQVQKTNQGLQPAAQLTNQGTCVQAISSRRPGVGKSLFIQRYKEKLQKVSRHDCCITVPLQTLTVHENVIAKTLIGKMQPMNARYPRIVHLDVSPNVCSGLDHLLFNLLVLNTICCPDGSVWCRQFYDLYLVEVTHATEEEKQKDAKGEKKLSKEKLFESLPTVLCRPPREVKVLEDQKLQGQLPTEKVNDPLMDDIKFRSASFQRPYRYLVGLDNQANLDAFRFSGTVYGNHADCLATLLKHCGLPDPSWSELFHFTSFLNKQLEACEGSIFCDLAMLADTGLDGFKTFVVKFMLQMSKDFATPSLQMSDESYRVIDSQEDQGNLEAFQLRRRWESSPHPYIFFNDDHQTMTFMGFTIDRNGTLLDVNGQELQRNLMTKNLMRGLELQRVNLSENFDSLPRDEKLKKLCMVMGIKYVSNPDDTYELTTDNVKKILAIHMRFRCGIPVIVMGETGCGKTRLIRFMCQLQACGLGIDTQIKNMILLKVHGGTSSKFITERVQKAEELARENKTQYNIDTILFFDEANTTEAIGIIKEIMCDGRMNGQAIDFNGSGLKIVAACNPYKRHTKEMIERLEAAGLGYHIEASKTKDRLGRIPLRQLVYRVQALPPSMLPLVWDFGQLNSDVETMYIGQIVQRFVNNGQLYATTEQVQGVSDVLSVAQAFMREQKNECSFVSLRDVERTLNVMVWFLNKRDLLRPLSNQKMQENLERRISDEDSSVYTKAIDNLTWALILALGVCYHACLDKKRDDFRRTVAHSFQNPLILHGGHIRIYHEINSCQEIFLDQIQMGPNIARNMALKENIFMMIICIELRIPLFLVGKPGSSKSLAKTIVADAMQGDNAATEIFKNLKQVHMISYQCSPLSTPDGIVGTFRQCSRFQESKDLDKFVSVVVLDEVGLAEDSPRMPLKTLHPLLEYGSEEDDSPEKHKKVAFIGISNWALDPAKMNRGILVSRGVPDKLELIDSAKGICALETSHTVSQILPPLAEGYLEIYEKQEQDFFGLRDFYSLIKMVNQFSKYSGKQPTWAEIEHAIRRNFGGMEGTEEYIEIFEKKLEGHVRKEKHETDPDCTPSGLIKASLAAQGQTQSGTKKVGHGTSDGDSRYLLVLTEKFAALPILQQHLNKMKDAVIIYGSSFPFDQKYTQVCRNINRIKLCMEAGRTVVLLNLENLYESLYDALNQYYVYFGGQRYVDLGLGTHRVKCRVHESFRLIVVADKQVVHDCFPIPLINRLEKHFLAMTTMLSEEQQIAVQRLEDWVTEFTTIRSSTLSTKSTKDTFKKSDAFIGYHGDTVAALVYQMWSLSDKPDEVFEKVKNQLLTCATPESVTRLPKTNMTQQQRDTITHIYFNIQKHGCLADYLGEQIEKNHFEGTATGILAQVTTYSRLLTKGDSDVLAKSTKLEASDIEMVSLQEFQHEQQFSIRVQKFFDGPSVNERLLLVQCDASSDTKNLISCACYRVQDERENALSAIKEQMQMKEDEGGMDLRYQQENRAHVVFIIQLPRVNRCFDGFQGGLWLSAHIDDLQPPKENRPDVSKLMGRPMSELFTNSSQQKIQVEHVPDVSNENLEEATFDNQEIDEERMEHDSNDEESMEHDSGEESMKHDSGEEERMSHQSDVESMENESSDEEPTEDMEQDEEVVVDKVTNSEHEFVADSEYNMVEDREYDMVADSKYTEQDEIVDEMENKDTAPLVDFIAVLHDCIHPAMARIIDPTNQRHRSTERVCLLVELMNGASSNHDFLHLLKQRILHLVKEKEARAVSASDWLTHEALGIKEVQESGTFRQACWQRLTATVASFLAEVIAVCDISNNLQLLQNQEACNAWLHQLWLNIFSSKELINISYDMCLSPEKKVQRLEVPVVEKGFGGKSFTACFPFSWIVKAKLEDVWKFSSEAKAGAEVSPERQFLKNLRESEVGRMLDSAIDMGGCQDVVQCYANDFVKITCKVSQEQEHMLICDELVKTSFLIVRELGGKVESVDSVAGVNLAFIRLQARIEHLSQLIELCPRVLCYLREEEKMSTDQTEDTEKEKERNKGRDTEETRNEEERRDVDKMTADVKSLRYVLENINEKDFKSQDGQRKWLKMIHILCPVVQSMISLYKKNGNAYGANNQKILDECRCLWSRITVMKLFFEHVSLPNNEFAEIVSPQCKALWVAMAKTADLKSNVTIDRLVKTLNLINKKAGESYYKSGIHVCGICHERIKDPVLLPCEKKHVFCLVCIKEYNAAETIRKCPMCKWIFPEEFECKGQSEVREVIEKHNAFRQCCNSFFMEVVSQLCFADGTPPCKEVIERLLGYVTIESKKQKCTTTRNVSPFPEDCIDPNPVVRSFLLQLLLQSNLESVKEHVQSYLQNSKDLMKGSAVNAVSVVTLFINCLEDTYYSGCPKKSDANQISVSLNDAHKKLCNAQRFLADKNTADDLLSVVLLEAISQIRFALTILIDVTQHQHTNINVKRLVNMLNVEAREFCQQNKEAHLYLVKYICKAYGRDALKRLKGDAQFDWILPDELKVKEPNIPDNFIILGETYRKVREAIGQCLVDKDFEVMFKTLTNLPGKQKEREVCLLLALFREITMNAANTVEAKMITLEVKKKFGEVIQNMPFVEKKVIADILLQNRGQHPNYVLRVKPGLTHIGYSIQAAVTHLQVALNIVEKQSLTQCLAIMMTRPSTMQNSYLPTMPQDDRMEAKAALGQSGGTWYECPNGHPYTIGDCGKPYYSGKCPACGLPIGGQSHKPHEGNKEANMYDTTATGHVLGNAQNHGNQAVCERTMNCVSTAVVRFLLHASMLLGTECQNGPQPIINIIQPAPVDVFAFLWQHLHNDVRLLSVATGKSTDDCLFILHKVIDNILYKKAAGDLQKGFQQLLTSKNCRKIWEQNFTEAFIKPAVQGLDVMIDQSNRALINDKRLSDDPLMRILHTTKKVNPDDLHNLVETSHVWQYRNRITIQSIHQTLESHQDRNTLQVLKLFMEKEKHLRFVRYLPDILRLQHLLINKYNRHIDSSEAIKFSITKFINHLHASEKEEFKNLIDTFITTWNAVRQDVALTVNLQIPKECCSEVMTENSNVAMLLPMRREAGLCSTGLVDFLIITQNEFLERYHGLQKEDKSKVKVDPSDLLQSHLIAYDPDRDLLPLILSQCQYIMRPMAGNKVEYNLQSLELQLIERFVRGRAIIDRNFEQMFFRQDFRNATNFDNLRAKIPQVELSTAVQSSIISELKSYPDLCGSLASLDIAIGFLANYTPEGNMLIKDYLRDKLAMPPEKGLKSSTASQQCHLKHVLALWQVLAVEKAVRLTLNSQDPFDGIGEEYREELDDEQKEDLKTKLRHIKVDQLCAELYEYIVLSLGQQNNADEDRTKWQILYTLEAHYESKNENGEIPELDRLPDTLTLSHAVDTWKTIAMFHHRQSVQG